MGDQDIPTWVVKFEGDTKIMLAVPPAGVISLSVFTGCTSVGMEFDAAKARELIESMESVIEEVQKEDGRE